MKRRSVIAPACVLLGLALAGGAAAEPPISTGPPATAQSLAIEILAADQSIPATTVQLSGPPAVSSTPAAFSYPDDGSIVTASSATGFVSASSADGTAAAVSDVKDLSLFGGEITADEVRASVSSAGTIGDLSESRITNLVVLGQPIVAPDANQEVPLADWGSLLLLGQTTKARAGGTISWRGTLTGLVVRLDADHGGLAAGTRIRIGFADAYARSPAPPVTTTTAAATTQVAPFRPPPAPGLPTVLPHGVGGAAGVTASAGTAAAGPRQMPQPGQQTTTPTKKTTTKKAKKKGGPPVLGSFPDVTPELTAGGYVFPVYGPSGYGDTFGALRGDVAGGWHHGDDVFAPLGAPILAVSDGTVFSVGWNEVGGWRLWLRDTGGNEFYYAHLSAYTTLAVNGRRVKAGDVLGFVGNTGDALGTPFHLHFEVHPVSMLFLGYDGAVDPTTYLDAWKRLEDVRILPAVPFSTAAAHASSAPTPGAILLDSSDISTANGLDPGSLRRAMNRTPTAVPDLPNVGELPVPLPILDRA